MGELFNFEFEQSVIGSILLDPDLYTQIAAFLSVDAFGDQTCGAVFATAAKLVDRGEPIDFLTIADDLEKRTASGDWTARLGSIMRNTPSTANAEAYAQAVAGYAQVRKLHRVGQEICKACFDADSDISEKIASAQQSVMSVLSLEASRGPRHAVEAARAWWAAVEAASKSDDGIMGVKTGYGHLDARLKGLRESELIIIAARPGKGKTVAALNISAATFNRRKNVLFFSLEMSGGELMGRIASSETQIPYNELQRGWLTDGQRIANNDFMSRIKGLTFWIDDSPGLRIDEIRARARAMSAKQKLDLIVVDYLQLVKGVGENENIKVNSVSTGLKEMAKELRCPVVALSQLNREVDKRLGQRPILSDLRGSGGIEQDADIIIFISEPCEGKTLFETAKHRRGVTGEEYFDRAFDVMRFNPCGYVATEKQKQKNDRWFKDD